jgi:hypothetical protein
MSKLTVAAKRLLTVVYSPFPEQRPFLDRAQTKKTDALEVTAVALSDPEARRFFGVRLARKGIQPVWIRVVNRTDGLARLELYSVDPLYYTPLEAAYINHFALGKRLLSFGLLAWMFLPLLPVVPFKFFSARSANRRMNAVFKEHGFSSGPILPEGERSGFVFTTVDEGTKSLNLKIVSGQEVCGFGFELTVPGLTVHSAPEEIAAERRDEVDEAKLRSWLESQPRCTTNKAGDAEGDPLNLVIVGDRKLLQRGFGARWDEVEAITLETSLKMARAFLFDAEYRYSPVSPLYYAGRMQDIALQKARATINERIHLRLWLTPLLFRDQPVWIGQVSRDIGVRFTPRTWNLTTHRIDPDVDEARDYVIDGLVTGGYVSLAGYVGGVDAAPATSPRRNLTGDPYFTDGSRAVIMLSKSAAEPAVFSWG